MRPYSISSVTTCSHRCGTRCLGRSVVIVYIGGCRKVADVAKLLKSMASPLGFLHFYRPGGQVITQKISSWARKRRASSIDKMVRPNGPVEAHRFFQSDQ